MNTRKLYFFNPDHDLTLANGDENFYPPQLARIFGMNLRCLPIWYAQSGSIVLAKLHDRQWFEKLKQIFPQLNSITLEQDPAAYTIDAAIPWGWNNAVRKFFISKGIDEKHLPDVAALKEIRRLSHRAMSIEALNFLHNDKSLSHMLPAPAQALTTNEITGFLSKNSRAVFKAPWSGSGRGLFWINAAFSGNATNWCTKIIEKQGCIIGEEAYDKVQDFAMEFSSCNGLVHFAGYSLFETEPQGTYKSNSLKNNGEIVGIISKYISQSLLEKVKEQLILFIKKEIAPYYSGYLGIDMMLYKKENEFFLHPCVEINLRMTMGMVARLFYDNFVEQQRSGDLYIDYYPKAEDLFRSHLQYQDSMKLETKQGKIISGYLSLSPILNDSHFRARIVIY